MAEIGAAVVGEGFALAAAGYTAGTGSRRGMKIRSPNKSQI
jgi:hypothetical protein